MFTHTHRKLSGLSPTLHIRVSVCLSLYSVLSILSMLSILSRYSLCSRYSLSLLLRSLHPVTPRHPPLFHLVYLSLLTFSIAIFVLPFNLLSCSMSTSAVSSSLSMYLKGKEVSCARLRCQVSESQCEECTFSA